jgi:hypothetical protein
MPRLNLIGPTYPLQTGADVQRTVNMYPEAVESGAGKGAMALIGTPGLSLFCTLASGGPVRTLITCFGVNTSGTDISNGLPRVYAIAGPVGSNCKLYELFTSGTATERGTLNCNSDEGPFSVAYSNDEMIIAHGTNFPWLYRFGSNAFVQLDAIHQTPATTDPNLNLYQVVYMDGYFVGIVGGTQQLRISALANGFSWDALDVASANAKPDILTGILQDGKELWLFGQDSIQPYWNTGDADFPFEPVGGQLIEIGCGAVWSIAKLDGAKFWLSHDSRGRGMVMRADGYNARRISNHAVEGALRGYANLHKAIGFTYQDNGHGFYVLYVPGAPTTWVYDVATDMWHERVYRNPGTAAEEAHRMSCHCFAFWEASPYKGKHLVGDRENGNIYVLDPAVYLDNSNPIKRLRRTPHFASEGKRVFYHSAQVDHLTGTALSSGQGSAPVMYLRLSSDGGQTWGQEYQAGMGALGQTTARARWTRLGSARDRVFEVSSTEPIKQVWQEGYVDYTGGLS